MKLLIGVFLSGVVVGYLIDKITSLIVLILITLIVVGYFLPGAHNIMFYKYITDIVSFAKSQIQEHPDKFSLSSFIAFKNLSLIVFLAGVIVGFKIA